MVSARTVFVYIAGLVQGCSNSIANALELLQSCTKPSIWDLKPLPCWINFRYQKHIFINLQHLECRDNWNHSSRKTYVLCSVLNTIATDCLATEKSQATELMVLVCLIMTMEMTVSVTMAPEESKMMMSCLQNYVQFSKMAQNIDCKRVWS